MAERKSGKKDPFIPDITIADIYTIKKDGSYFYMSEIEELLPEGRVKVKGYGEMIMLSGYSYLGLINHPKINAAAIAAINKYGTGTHGVRLLAGTETIHNSLEQKIAKFKKSEAAAVYSSGYVTNFTTISALIFKDDVVLCDKLDHTSIVDGSLASGARFVRFKHNNMEHLEKKLQSVQDIARKLVVVDAVFSMDGDIINLPQIAKLCKKYKAKLMVDEAHSLGILGKTGHGIEEHFNLPPDTIDIKMGTLSKTIPSVGGYIAGSEELITYLKHQSHAFIFSAALPPPAVAAAEAAFDVIEEEPERIKKLNDNYECFTVMLRKAGFNLLNTQVAIIPVMCNRSNLALQLGKYCQQKGVFVQAIVPPAVPPGTDRLRACVSAAHSIKDIEYCAETIIAGGRELGII